MQAQKTKACDYVADPDGARAQLADVGTRLDQPAYHRHAVTEARSDRSEPSFWDPQAAGAVIAARAEDAGVEAIELPAHPFFFATEFQPQVGSSATRQLHPLLQAFLAAAREWRAV
jgi:CTP synthase (UTP-ammonia lyase)